MFHEACRCGGVPERKAKIIFAAVYHFGPRWELELVSQPREVTVTLPDGTPQQRTVTYVFPVAKTIATLDPLPSTPKKLQEFIDAKNPSLEDIEKISPNNLPS